MLYWIVRAIFYIPIKILYPTKVVGKKNLLNEKCILTSNHQSKVDGPIIVANIRKKILFLAKAELFNSCISSVLYNNLGVIPVNRGKPDIGAVKRVLTALKNNKIIGIFPGGTRRKDFNEQENFKNGVAMFAIKSNAPVIPMMFFKKPKILRFNKLIIGKPIYLDKPTGKLSKEYLDECTKLLKQKQDELIITKEEK